MNKPEKRLRIFAGPNGSGKTTLAIELSENKKFHLKNFVNADLIESAFNEFGYFNLVNFQFHKVNSKDVQEFFRLSGMLNKNKSINNRLLFNDFNIKNDKLYFNGVINSYVASDIASFIRLTLIENGVSFAFETVFSHESKLDFMKYAQSIGYKVYFYFLTTDDPDINVNRVNIRVEKNGHSVPEDKIRARYYRSLDLMFEAVKNSYRAFLFDNSGKYNELVAEVTQGKKVKIHDIDGQIPCWFEEYFYNKTKSRS